MPLLLSETSGRRGGIFIDCESLGRHGLFEGHVEFLVGDQDFEEAGLKMAVAGRVDVAEVPEFIDLEAEGFRRTGADKTFFEEFQFLVRTGDGADRVADIPMHGFLAVTRAVVRHIDLEHKRRVRNLADVAIDEVRIAQAVTEPVHRLLGNVLVVAHERAAGPTAIVIDRNLTGRGRESQAESLPQRGAA